MFQKTSLGNIKRSLSAQASNPEVLKAQCQVLSRLIPLTYAILLVNSWTLAYSFLDLAPAVLTTVAVGLMTGVCIIRLVVWWHRRGEAITTEGAARELRRTVVISVAFGAAFSSWALLLFPYGDDLAKSHVAFFLMISTISTMFCLIHVRGAALVIATVGGGSFIGFFALSGVPVFVSMSVNMGAVVAASVIVVLILSRDFARMVTAQAEARRKNREQARLLRMIDDMPLAVMTVEPETLRINYINDMSRELFHMIEHLLPLPIDELLGTSIDVFHLHPEHQRRILGDPAHLPHSARIMLGSEVLDLKVSAVTDEDGSYIGPMLTWALVTKEVEAERHVLQLAHFDTLTGLPNRTSFSSQLEERLATPDQTLSLMYLDLDGFKLVNDTWGHRVGDVLLRAVAERLRTCCERQEATIGRLGGDEFAILLPDGAYGTAEVLAATLISTLSAPYRLEHDQHVQIGASIGIAHYPMHATRSDTLLARADMALYAAKAAGKRGYKVFSADMEHQQTARVRLEAQLRAALELRNGLFVFYQPIVDIDTGRVSSREALLRWHHRSYGWIPPVEFVPIAEQSSLIEQLGAYVLMAACHEAVTWEDDVRVAVNVSAGQLGQGSLEEAVRAALRSSRLPPERLEIEVTETALLSDGEATISELRRLRTLGVRVALDDFGTGYSSLAHLRLFPFDKIKIDGSFVRDAVDRPDCAAVVRAIAELGTRLGVTTVAEGVETLAHLDRVRQEGCREVQGYLFGRPEPRAADLARVSELETLPSAVTFMAKAG